MSTLTIALPDPLKRHLDEQVESRGFGTGGDYVLDLIRRDRDRHALRGLLLDGAASEAGDAADDDYFAALRLRAQPGG